MWNYMMYVGTMKNYELTALSQDKQWKMSIKDNMLGSTTFSLTGC